MEQDKENNRHEKIKYQDMDSNAEQLNNLKAETNPAKDFLYFVLDLLKTGIIVFIIAFSLRYFAIQPFIVDGESMMPNYTNNEYILAEKVSYLAGSPKRGDVIVFRYPGNPKISYIKRIIGLPGDKVKIENNKITITNDSHPNGVELDESYLPVGTLTQASGNLNGYFEQVVGPSEYFVMGDNRQHSSDSREWGLLPRENIIGRAWLTIMPSSEFGIHKRVSYPGLSFHDVLGTAFAKN